MNKYLISGLIAVLIIGAGAFVFIGGDDDIDNSINSVSQETLDAAGPLPENQSANSQVSNYVDYSEEALVASADSKRIVFFHAPWCSTCNFFEQQIEKQGIPEGIVILKADFDKDTATKQKYGVSVQSTFVLLDENGEVERVWPFASGLRGIEDLYAAVI